MRRALILSPALAVLVLAAIVGYQPPAMAQTADDDLFGATDETTDPSADTDGQPSDEAAADDASSFDDGIPSEPTDTDQSIADDATVPTDSADDAAADLSADAGAAVDANGNIVAQPTDPSQPQPDQRPAPPNLDQPQPGQPLDPNQPADPATGTAGAQADANGNVEAQRNLGLQFGQPTPRGLTLNAIDQQSVFFDSGLRRGDVLMSFNGRPVRSQAAFYRWATYFPGQRVPIVILREGRPQTIYITYEASRFPQDPGFDPDAQQFARAYLGVTFDPRYRNTAVVRSVAPESPAAQAGLRPGDTISALNGGRIRSPYDVVQVIGTMRPGERMEIDFTRRVTGRSEVVLAHAPQPRYTAAYPPNPNLQTTPPQPAPPQFVNPPAVPSRNLDGNVVRPGDPDDDGRLLDGDGRVNRRPLRERR